MLHGTQSLSLSFAFWFSLLDGLSVENILIRCDLHALEEEGEDGSSPWNARGANGWRHHGILLSNFSSTIDTQELPRQVCYPLLLSVARWGLGKELLNTREAMTGGQKRGAIASFWLKGGR